jgi:hypothetical protein
MKLNLPEGTTIQGVTFATPRVGNPAWATFFDSQITEFIRLNNKRDPVPTVPGRRLGFRHPHGEIHIQRNGLLVACLGEYVLPCFALLCCCLYSSSSQVRTKARNRNAAMEWCQISWKDASLTTSGHTTASSLVGYSARHEVLRNLILRCASLGSDHSTHSTSTALV